MTGRRRFMDVSLKQEEMMAKEAYKQVVRQVRWQYTHVLSDLWVNEIPSF